MLGAEWVERKRAPVVVTVVVVVVVGGGVGVEAASHEFESEGLAKRLWWRWFLVACVAAAALFNRVNL